MTGNGRLRFAVWLAFALASMITSLPAADREPAIDRPGHDYKAFELTAPLPDQCEKACKDDARCQAWTFAWPGKRAGRAHCSLKSSAPPKKSDNCCISGLRDKSVAEQPTAPAAQTVQPKTEEAGTLPDQPSPVDLTVECNEYARQAVAMSEENELLMCGLSGGRWGVGHERYHNWCMTKSTPETRKANTLARANAIAQCRNAIGLPSHEQAQANRSAELEKTCQEYANTATQQAGAALSRRCGVGGPRWLTAYHPHFSWCMTASAAERISEAKRRDATLAECTGRQSASLECDDYARVALDQTREAQERRCGFEGPRWRRNYGAHKNWCRKAGTDARAAETHARARSLNACRRSPRIAAGCSRYAISAISAAQQNIDRKCGLQGPRWDLQADQHFMWCMNAQPHERRRERATRIAALLKCGKPDSAGQIAPRPEGFEYRWRKVSRPGGDWTSNWFSAGTQPVCEHLVRGCQCGAANYCGTYRRGDVALWWSAGCIRRPWEIVCEVRSR